MTALEEARSAIKRLSLSERQLVLEELFSQSVEVAPGIFRTPGVCGGDACVRQMRIPVWSLEEGRRNGMTEDLFLQNFPNLTSEDLTNAWRYVDAHRDEIQGLIEENNQV